MTVLSYNELVELISSKVIKAPLSAVQGSSVDVTLGRYFYREWDKSHPDFDGLVMPTLTDKFQSKIDSSISGGFMVDPGEFILAEINEKLNLPLDISAQFMLKSSIARCGLNHQLAGWIDSGYRGTITLELTNVLKHHTIALKEGMPIGQIVFFRHRAVPHKKSYIVRGQYNGAKGVEPNKGAK